MNSAPRDLVTSFLEFRPSGFASGVAANKKATKLAKFDAPTRRTENSALLLLLPSRPHQVSANPSTLLVSGAVVKEDRMKTVSGVFEWLQDSVTGCLPGARRSPRLYTVGKT